MQAYPPDGPAVINAPPLGSLEDFETETALEGPLDITPARHPSTRLATMVTVHEPESNGVIIATLLSILAVTYGSFLTASWRHPVEVRAGSAPASLESAAVAPVVAPVVASPVVVVPSGPPVAAPASVEPKRAAARRGTGAMSARTLTALWKQQDTRSLYQAFAGLRRQTLAFHRCGMRKTADDRAVAKCDSDGSTWTIDFQRSDGRWQIANVSTR